MYTVPLSRRAGAEAAPAVLSIIWPEKVFAPFSRGIVAPDVPMGRSPVTNVHGPNVVAEPHVPIT